MIEPRLNSSGGEKKSAFVISPQPWDGFKVSKHHYAVALARSGWQVYFIDPPRPFQFARRIQCQAAEVDGIQRVSYSLPVPGWAKFHARPLFDRAMRRHARRLTSELGTPDLVWDFDNSYQFRDLRPFGATKSIFHLVDQGLKGMGDKHADSCIHLHPSFCEWAGFDPSRSFQIGHGVSVDFIDSCATTSCTGSSDSVLTFGVVGNLAAKWFDWDTVLEIARRQPSARFVLWGPHPSVDRANGSLRAAMESSQFHFRGLSRPEDIAASSGEVDVWLVPFLNEALPGGPLNSHKILEYLSTGRVVAMTWLEAWEENPHVSMLEKSPSDSFADLVDKVAERLADLNSSRARSDRLAFARRRTYEHRLNAVLTSAGFAAEGL
ncbi:hypothetical protein N9159_00615 [bacterium]|nr:hypothetical protein [bacterium]